MKNGWVIDEGDEKCFFCGLLTSWLIQTKTAFQTTSPGCIDEYSMAKNDFYDFDF